jgi:hypothetical protein
MTFDVTTNPSQPTIVHDPEAYLDYGWDLTNLIDPSDILSAATFVAPLGVTVDAITLVGNVAYGWVKIDDPTTWTLSKIAITCHFTTINGRIDDRTLYFKIKDR